MIENEQNVRLVHELAIMPDPIYARKPLKWYLGRSVKMAFQAESGHVEHMWVAVAEIDGPYLVGTLENHPVFITHQSCGDSITFTRWNQWELSEDDPLTFLTEIFEGKPANHGV